MVSGGSPTGRSRILSVQNRRRAAERERSAVHRGGRVSRRSGLPQRDVVGRVLSARRLSGPGERRAVDGRAVHHVLQVRREGASLVLADVLRCLQRPSRPQAAHLPLVRRCRRSSDILHDQWHGDGHVDIVRLSRVRRNCDRQYSRKVGPHQRRNTQVTSNGRSRLLR